MKDIEELEEAFEGIQNWELQELEEQTQNFQASFTQLDTDMKQLKAEVTKQLDPNSLRKTLINIENHLGQQF